MPHWLDAVLSRFEGQVYIDLSWVVYEDYILKDPEPWAALIRKYPQSFMLGSDVVGGGENMGSEFREFEALLNEISTDPGDQVRRNLARDNFVRLMTDLGQRRRANMEGANVLTPDATDSTGLILRSDYEFDERAHTGVRAHSFMQANKPKP
jgi:hypothetical protein